MAIFYSSSQTIYLANPDGATDCVISQSSGRINFYCDHQETCVYQVPLSYSSE